MSYRVFARKYRPQTFEEVVGQEHLTRTLQNAIRDNRVAQAYLFVGPRGIGKTSCARILAKALNCQHGPTPHPCGKCDSCREIAEGRNLDVIEIDGASNNGVENIRDLRENAAYAPARGPFKIYLIDEVHMLSAGAFNALLKTLEEPPAHIKFIFATTEAQKVPATITSRCQRFDLRRIPLQSIISHLQLIASKEKISLENGAAEAIAKAADGGLRDAESMLDQAVAFCGDSITQDAIMTIFGFTPKEVIATLTDQILAGNAPAALSLLASQSDSGKDLSRLISDLTAHLRDLLVQGITALSPSKRTALLKLLDHFAETENRIRWASDKKLHCDVAIIKAVHLLQQASLDEILDTLTALRDNTSSPRKSPPPSPKSIATPSPVPPTARTAEENSPQPVLTEEKISYHPLQTLPNTQQNAQPNQHPAELASETDQTAHSLAWSEICNSNKDSLIFSWLKHGVFQKSTAEEIHIHFPLSDSATIKSLVGEKARTRAEQQLKDILGKKIRLIFNINPQITESPEEPPRETGEVIPPTQPPQPPKTQKIQIPPSEELTDFRNDPLIRKALEIFKAELEAIPTKK